MNGRSLLQYIIDTSDILLAKKQEATEYLAQLEDIKATQKILQALAATPQEDAPEIFPRHQHIFIDGSCLCGKRIAH